ncbi:MAG: hypothetical protein M1827_002525 [Pycnora praestabilis]|nr:MAG: hypothetical protein M1827_002525 [Pycnora praestabilis]
MRNPAAYVKRSELATPSRIDHDFNFLSNLERQIDSAEKDAESRGIELEQQRARGKKRDGPRKGEANTRSAIQRSGVIVDGAPKGMSRAKNNNTMWNPKRQCLTWTVELVYYSGQRELIAWPETSSPDEACSRRMEGKQPRLKKQKLALKKSLVPQSASILKEASDPFSERVTESPQPQPVLKTEQITCSEREVFFYLLRPHTTSSSRVLIPIVSSSPLSASLKDQVVLEFPTIYILNHPQSALPEGFMLESEYLGHRREEEKELDEMLSKVPAPLNAPEMIEDGEKALQEALDRQKIMDVLRKDLGVSR